MLLLIVIHYIYYIINAIAGDLQTEKIEQNQRKKQQQQNNRNSAATVIRPPTLDAPRFPPPEVAATTTSELGLFINNLANSSCSSANTMQTNDDAKFIKKCVCMKCCRVGGQVAEQKK